MIYGFTDCHKYIKIKHMKTITLALQKGGTGKTSMSVTLAAELAKHGKTLLIDADPQGNATTWIKGGSITAELADILNDKAETKEVLQTTCIKDLYILPTAGLGGDLRTFQKEKANNKPFAMMNAIEPIQSFFDYCIIDTSPNFDTLNISAFMASDEIIAVLQFNEFSKDGLQIFLDNLTTTRKDWRISNDKAVLNKIILNAKDERIKQQENILQTFKQLEAGGYSLFVVPVDQAFNKAQAMHTSIQDLAGTKKETLQAIGEIVKAVML